MLELDAKGSRREERVAVDVLEVVVLLGLVRFEGLSRLASTVELVLEVFLLGGSIDSAEEGLEKRGEVMLIDGATDALTGDAGRLDAREGGREELESGLRGVVPGVVGRVWLIVCSMRGRANKVGGNSESVRLARFDLSTCLPLSLLSFTRLDITHIERPLTGGSSSQKRYPSSTSTSQCVRSLRSSRRPPVKFPLTPMARPLYSHEVPPS